LRIRAALRVEGGKEVTFDEWVESVPIEIKNDPIWQMVLYWQALFLGELAWFDVCKLAQDKRTQRIADQLYRAVGGISTTICEGYSRRSNKDQARFYEYALGSSRETRDWYYKARYVLSEHVALHRIRLTVHVIRQLLKLVPEYRAREVREEVAQYEIFSESALLYQVPMPD
jgi:four helix bundle protein